MGTNNLKGPGPGRTPGDKNKINRDIVAKLDMLGFDPVERLISIINNPDAKLDLQERASSNLLKYIYPAKKEMQISGTNFTFKWADTKEELALVKTQEIVDDTPPIP